jgi:hypothetical protein
VSPTDFQGSGDFLKGRQKAPLWQSTSPEGKRQPLRLALRANRNDGRLSDGGADVFLPRRGRLSNLPEMVKRPLHARGSYFSGEGSQFQARLRALERDASILSAVDLPIISDSPKATDFNTCGGNSTESTIPLRLPPTTNLFDFLLVRGLLPSRFKRKGRA